MSNPSLEQMMAELKLEYLQGMTSRIEKIRASLLALNLAELINEFHKLKGTGKTYGFLHLTEIGESMETYLKNCEKENVALDAKAVETSLSWMQEIQKFASENPGSPWISCPEFKEFIESLVKK